jgi:Asp-tRNA(Asn)/Glu-tRNA(Gln) amidotransferase A subunit family amidase
MNAIDLCFMPATELARAIRAKEISPVEAVEAPVSAQQAGGSDTRTALAAH